jgi:hypothetical protein
MSPSAKDMFALVVAELRDLLKPRGFVKRGNRFGLRRGDDWGVIDFQMHNLATTKESVSFVINLGVWIRAFEDVPQGDPPAISRCHWNRRVGGEPPEADERWWIIDRETDLARVVPLVTRAIEAALPMLEQHMNAATIIGLFLQGKNADLRIGISYRDRIQQLASKL